MWNVKNLYFSSTAKELGYYYGVKICDLIKNYLKTAFKTVMILALSIVTWIWGKSRIRQMFRNIEWDREIEKTRLEMKLRFIPNFIMTEARKPEGVPSDVIRLAFDRLVNSYQNPQEIYRDMKRIGIDEANLRTLIEMNMELKAINNETEKAFMQRRATREQERYKIRSKFS